MVVCGAETTRVTRGGLLGWVQGLSEDLTKGEFGATGAGRDEDAAAAAAPFVLNSVDSSLGRPGWEAMARSPYEVRWYVASQQQEGVPGRLDRQVV